jgi:TRAP-type C4-dicarboxylate transport system permease small subunit
VPTGVRGAVTMCIVIVIVVVVVIGVVVLAHGPLWSEKIFQS